MHSLFDQDCHGSRNELNQVAQESRVQGVFPRDRYQDSTLPQANPFMTERSADIPRKPRVYKEEVEIDEELTAAADGGDVIYRVKWESPDGATGGSELLSLCAILAGAYGAASGYPNARQAVVNHILRTVPAAVAPDAHLGAELVRRRNEAGGKMLALTELGWRDRHKGHLHYAVLTAIATARRLEGPTDGPQVSPYRAAIKMLKEVLEMADERGL